VEQRESMDDTVGARPLLGLGEGVEVGGEGATGNQHTFGEAGGTRRVASDRGLIFVAGCGQLA